MNPCTKASTAMMKKILPLIATGLFLFSGSNGQVRLGLLGGIHSASVLETNSIPGWDSTTKKYQSSKTGVQVGAILDIPIGHKGFFFQPALTYTSKGRQFSKSNDSTDAANTDTVYTKSTLSLGYIEVPLNLTYKIPLGHTRKNSFFISAGPSISFFYNGKVSSQSLTDSTGQFTNTSSSVSVGKGPDTYKTVDVGVNGRAGFEFGNVLLSAYFSRGLTSFYNATYPGTFHHQVIGASLGIWLTSSAPPPPPPVKDTDKDGIPDDQDLCPLQPGTLAWHGCPVPDTDKDGIDDEHDSCKTIPGYARYNGCPVPDTDHDGIDDEHDSCPTIAGVGRYNGCPVPDRDGDGVNDEVDSCPDTPGTAENKGCPVPVIKKETVEKVNFIAKNILFTPASTTLTDSSFIALDELANVLQEHTEVHLTIEGYTDNLGTPQKNLLLSQKRAQAVKTYLVRKGIPEKRITAIGLGQEHPIADNTTPAGRAVNRRVELKISTE
jgi:OOP family OmpA-OmpF porin